MKLLLTVFGSWNTPKRILWPARTDWLHWSFYEQNQKPPLVLHHICSSHTIIPVITEHLGRNDDYKRTQFSPLKIVYFWDGLGFYNWLPHCWLLHGFRNCHCCSTQQPPWRLEVNWKLVKVTLGWSASFTTYTDTHKTLYSSMAMAGLGWVDASLKWYHQRSKCIFFSTYFF